ncbi:small nuclear ribonucleoprotein lsm2, partial [Diaporthe amygdali]|uniref:small nuclear ribonucleoprotein lsm2 n=1 Tax=Phomopsis amygdali TaxID=1214568 RepID=UPI0022FDFF80
MPRSFRSTCGFIRSPHRPHLICSVLPLIPSHQHPPRSTQSSSLTDAPLPRANSFFKTLIDQSVTVELKNDIKVTGTLKSVDQYLNIKLDDISVHEELRYPHLSAVKNVFIRGSVVRYVHLPASAVDVTLLEDAARR